MVAHNTVWSTQAPFSSIEWRFDATSVRIENNVSSHNHRERTPGIATLVGNLDNGDPAWFVDADGGDLHLSGADPVDGAVSTPATPDHDLEGTIRDATPDVGAYER
jgi:hypothetical protein